MSDESDYISFRDSLLVAVADEQEPPGVRQLNLYQVAADNELPSTETWLQMVSADFERLGYGKTIFMGEDGFLINGAGLEAAALVRRARRPKTLKDHVLDMSRSDWIALGAFVVSLIALFR